MNNTFYVCIHGRLIKYSKTFTFMNLSLRGLAQSRTRYSMVKNPDFFAKEAGIHMTSLNNFWHINKDHEFVKATGSQKIRLHVLQAGSQIIGLHYLDKEIDIQMLSLNYLLQK